MVKMALKCYTGNASQVTDTLMERSQNIPIFGPQGEILLVRFSEDQPRDPDGKFESGGVKTYDAGGGKKVTIPDSGADSLEPLFGTHLREAAGTVKKLFGR